jgi:hypothetical protein
MIVSRRRTYLYRLAHCSWRSNRCHLSTLYVPRPRLCGRNTKPGTKRHVTFVRTLTSNARLMISYVHTRAQLLVVIHDAETNIGVFGDAERLSQLVSNLLRCGRGPVQNSIFSNRLNASFHMRSNASKFSPARTGTIECTMRLSPWNANTDREFEDGGDGTAVMAPLEATSSLSQAWPPLPAAIAAQLRARLEECKIQKPSWAILSISVR